LERLDKDIFI